MNIRSKILKNFIVIEGLDGAGTTTLVKSLGSFFTQNGKKALTTFEPTDSPIGTLIREEYLKKKSTTTSQALALLYAADRENHINNPIFGIKTAIKENIVISDRYLYSSLAYQSVNLDFDFINNINNFEEPEFLIYIDTPVDECLKRINKRGEEKELFEKKDFLEKTEANFKKAFSYLKSTENYKNGTIKFLSIDGTQSKEKVFENAIDFLKAYFLQD